MHANDAEKVRIAPSVVHGGELGTRTRASTPINLNHMIPFLCSYNNAQDAQLLREGFDKGFRIGAQAWATGSGSIS